MFIGNDGPLGPEWQDHALTGDWVTYREYHIDGEFLMIYRLDGKAPHEVGTFVRAGTHSDLFE